MMAKKKRAGNSPPESIDTCANVMTSLKQIYFSHMYNLEDKFMYNQTHSPLLSSGDFDSRPMVLLLGQYSTGKTTFIKHVVERDYQGILIGPEPTTDRFTAVEYGQNEQLVLGNAAVADQNSPYYQLSDFGNDFLSRFVVSRVPSNILKGITIIDTPGILSGSKQTTRGYEFEAIVRWFAERADLILLFFDAYKLDISDEFRRCIRVLKTHENKMRILLNKADSVPNRQLLRIFGALMWSLGKVIDSPEVVRIYVGSYWDKPLKYAENRELFEEEENDLFSDIARLPRSCSLRKMNDFVKRMRAVKCYVLLLNYLRKQIPMFNKDTKKRQLLADLQQVYRTVATESKISIGDFPPVNAMQEKLMKLNWNNIPKLDMKAVVALDNILQKNMPEYMKTLVRTSAEEDLAMNDGSIIGTDATPFFNVHGSSDSRRRHVDEDLKNNPIDVDKYRVDYSRLNKAENGMVFGMDAKHDLQKSKLPSTVLHRVWNLADLNRDGYLDLYEYSIARHLIELKLNGNELPAELPLHLRNAPASQSAITFTGSSLDYSFS